MKITDLTFAQLNEASLADPMIADEIFAFSGDTIYLDLKKLTGDTFSGINDNGVVEFMFKLRNIAEKAQNLVNNLLATNASENLTSFPPYTYGLPSNDGLIEVTQIQTVLLPIGFGGAIPSSSNQGLIGNSVIVGNDLFGN